MSVLIKGITLEQFYRDLNNVRDIDVGWDVVQIPPHGRLIDADALQKDIQKHADLFVNCGNLDLAAMAQRDGLSCALSDVVNAPTIIEAEEGE